jgi:hypothetical protein
MTKFRQEPPEEEDEPAPEVDIATGRHGGEEMA